MSICLLVCPSLCRLPFCPSVPLALHPVAVLATFMPTCHLACLSFCHSACLPVCHPVHPSITLSGFLSVCRLLPSLCYSPSYLSFLLLSWLPLCLPVVLPVCLSYTPLVYLPVILSIRLLICLPFYHAVGHYSTSYLPCLLLSLPTEEWQLTVPHDFFEKRRLWFKSWLEINILELIIYYKIDCVTS